MLAASVVDADGMRRLVRVLALSSDKAELVQVAKEVGKISSERGSDRSGALVEAGVLSPLLKHLRDEDASDKLKAQCARVLKNVLTGNSKSVAAAGAAGAVPLLVELLQKEDASVLLKTRCAGALTNALHQNADNTVEAGKVGAIEALLALLRRGHSADGGEKARASDVELQTRCAAALSNVLFGNAENTAAAGRAGAVESLLSLLRETADLGLKTRCAAALANLLTGNVENRVAAGEAGAVETLVALLQAANATDPGATGVGGADAGVSRRPTPPSAPPPKPSAKGKPSIARLPSFKQLDGHSAASVVLKTRCAAALANVLIGNSENKIAAGESGAVELLVALLRGRVSSDELKTQCAGALWIATVECQANVERAAAAGAESVLLELQQQTLTAETAREKFLHEYCTSALANLSTSSTGSEEVLADSEASQKQQLFRRPSLKRLKSPRGKSFRIRKTKSEPRLSAELEEPAAAAAVDGGDARSAAESSGKEAAADTVRQFLEKCGLTQYADQIVDEEGYDDMIALRTMTADEIKEDFGFMKRGHQKKLLVLLRDLGQLDASSKANAGAAGSAPGEEQHGEDELSEDGVDSEDLSEDLTSIVPLYVDLLSDFKSPNKSPTPDE